MVNKKGFYSRLVLTIFMVKSLKYSKTITCEGMYIEINYQNNLSAGSILLGFMNDIIIKKYKPFKYATVYVFP